MKLASRDCLTSIIACLVLQDYLPPAVQDAFLSTVAEFVVLPWKHAHLSATPGASQGGSQVKGSNAYPKSLVQA